MAIHPVGRDVVQATHGPLRRFHSDLSAHPNLILKF